MTNSVIMTGVDANYFELLKGLVIYIFRTEEEEDEIEEPALGD